MYVAGKKSRIPVFQYAPATDKRSLFTPTHLVTVLGSPFSPSMMSYSSVRIFQEEGIKLLEELNAPIVIKLNLSLTCS